MRPSVFLIFFFLPFTILGQFQDQIDTDRPGYSISPFTVGAKTSQAQAGFQYSDLKTQGIDIDGQKRTISRSFGVPDLNFRIGLWNKIELQGGIITPFDISDNSSVSGNLEMDGGLRVNFYDGKGPIPAIGFQVHFNTWLEVIPVTLAFKSRLSDRFSLTSNIRYEVVDQIGAFTLMPRFSVSDWCYVYIEYLYERAISNELSLREKHIHNFSTGLVFALNENFVVDVGYYTNGFYQPLNPLASSDRLSNAFEVGLSYRFDWRK